MTQHLLIMLKLEIDLLIRSRVMTSHKSDVTTDFLFYENISDVTSILQNLIL